MAYSDKLKLMFDHMTGKISDKEYNKMRGIIYPTVKRGKKNKVKKVAEEITLLRKEIYKLCDELKIKLKKLKALNKEQYKKAEKKLYKSVIGTLPDKRDEYYQKKYGITLRQYNQMLEKQNYMCVICGEEHRTDKKLVVDHCHISGKVRALLCNKCNFNVLGVYKDNYDIIKRALEYLEKHHKNELPYRR